MPNCAQDFLDQAKLLQANGGTEIEYRTAANRAYYSVYHNAVEIKKATSLPDPVNKRGGEHAVLYRSLEECKPRHSSKEFDIRRYGIMASRLLKPYRVHADYDLHKPFLSGIMDEVIAKAALLSGKAQQIIAEHKPGGGAPPPTTPIGPALRVVK